MTPACGSALSGVTTGFECGGGVTTTRTPEARPDTTRTADEDVAGTGSGANSMGG
jgi:hypothetical protein